MSRILVTDAETRTALATVRSLGRAGHRVCTVAGRTDALAAASRFVERHAVVPGPEAGAERYASAIARLAAEWQADLVLPVTDSATSALLAAPPHEGRWRLIAPPRAAYEALSDKAGLVALARAAGVPVPKTAVAETPADLAAAAAEIGHPCVLKPHRSVVEQDGRQQRFSVCYAETPADLARIDDPAAFPVLVQERIVGPGEGAFFLMDHGRTVACSAHRRLREYPASGGASTYRESIPVADDLRAHGERLLASVGWHGAAMVEFKRCAATGTAFLMEVNGRLWGSLALAIASGVDYPRMLVELAETGRTSAGAYRTGLRCRWFWGDVDHFLDRLLHSDEALELPPDAPSRLRALLAFFLWRPRRDRFEVFAWSDPRPFLRESRQWLQGRIGRRLARLARPRAGA